MHLLLDTHIFLWLMEDDRRYTESMDRKIQSAESIAVSAASIWEMAIKVSIGKLGGDEGTIRRYLEIVRESPDLDLLPILPEHTVGVTQLPFLHRDPFDRILIAQARHEGLMLMTVDKEIRKYDAEGRFVLPILETRVIR